MVDQRCSLVRMGVDIFDSYVESRLHFSYLTGRRIQIVLEVKREGKGEERQPSKHKDIKARQRRSEHRD